MEIKHEMDHYTLYISGVFSGSYDTFTEAVDAYIEITTEGNSKWARMKTKEI